MRIIGLTGSIGMGKTTVARMFAARGVPVHDADAAVHDLYRAEAVPLVEAAFPGTTTPDGVDRTKLGARVLGDEAAMQRLERIVHPLVQQRQAEFLEAARKQGASVAILDIPLLFETGRDKACDAVIVVSAPFDVQKSRVLTRPGMTEARFEAILARQLPDAEKRLRADHVIETGGALDETDRQVSAFLAETNGAAQ
jgi:dephospho-CoA kinase